MFRNLLNRLATKCGYAHILVLIRRLHPLMKPCKWGYAQLISRLIRTLYLEINLKILKKFNRSHVWTVQNVENILESHVFKIGCFLNWHFRHVNKCLPSLKILKINKLPIEFKGFNFRIHNLNSLSLTYSIFNNNHLNYRLMTNRRLWILLFFISKPKYFLRNFANYSSLDSNNQVENICCFW